VTENRVLREVSVAGCRDAAPHTPSSCSHAHCCFPKEKLLARPVRGRRNGPRTHLPLVLAAVVLPETADAQLLPQVHLPSQGRCAKVHGVRHDSNSTIQKNVSSRVLSHIFVGSPCCAGSRRDLSVANQASRPRLASPHVFWPTFPRADVRPSSRISAALMLESLKRPDCNHNGSKLAPHRLGRSTSLDRRAPSPCTALSSRCRPSWAAGSTGQSVQA